MTMIIVIKIAILIITITKIIVVNNNYILLNTKGS